MQKTNFNELTPMSDASKKRREREEFVLRFFAYTDRYKEFSHSVKEFLDDYASQKNEEFDKGSMVAEFEAVMKFAKENYPTGFHKPNQNRTYRIRFEALSVGAALALRENPKIKPESVDSWILCDEFLELTTSDASNSKPKVIKRIEYVRDQILGNQNAAS